MRTQFPTGSDAKLSKAAAQRLSQYLRCLAAGGPTASSAALAQSVGVSDAQVRRDLAAIGHLGQRGVGYDTNALTAALRKTLGIDRPWRAVLAGVGNLARALLRYRGFRQHGFEIVGLFDTDPAKIGTSVDGLTVEPIDRLGTRTAGLRAEMGIITVPADAAQSIADVLSTAGVTGILNFAPVLLRTSSGVVAVTVDLTVQFEQLAFLVTHREPADPPGRPAVGGNLAARQDR
ncbi:MAG TPA: redox-sensing transcriptional repressor Rex [Fimbriiglobus sp.]